MPINYLHLFIYLFYHGFVIHWKNYIKKLSSWFIIIFILIILSYNTYLIIYVLYIFIYSETFNFLKGRLVIYLQLLFSYVVCDSLNKLHKYFSCHFSRNFQFFKWSLVIYLHLLFSHALHDSLNKLHKNFRYHFWGNFQLC